MTATSTVNISTQQRAKLTTKSGAMDYTSEENAVPAAVRCDYGSNAPPLERFDKLFPVYMGFGDKERKVQVFHGVLCHHSLAFRVALKNDGKDHLWLPNTDPAIFDIVRYWMYTERFWDPKSAKDGVIPLSSQQVLSVYFFATDYIMPGLQNESLSLVYHVTAQNSNAPTTSQMKTIYKNTTPGSPLRRFLVAFSAEVWEFTDADIEFPRELLLDVLLRLQDVGGKPSAWEWTDWIEEMNETFCERLHVHKAMDDGGNKADDADGAGHSPDTVSEADNMES